MTYSLKYFAAAIVGMLVALGALAAFVSSTQANQLYFPITTTSATATTTAAFLTSSGQATSSALDAYQASVTNALDGLSLFVQFAASSTSSSLNIRFQYSYNNIDWYDDSVSQAVGVISTTTMTASLQPYLSYQWPAYTVATSSKILPVPTPMRYVRAVFTESGAAGAFWYGWQPVRQGK